MMNLKAVDHCLLRHKWEGLKGVRCGYHAEPGQSVRIGLSWDTITCPDCLKLKQGYEPENIIIDTRGD